VREEHEARRAAGYAGTLFVDHDVARVLGTDRYISALRFGGTFSIDPYAYCQGLRAVLEANGVAIHEASPVTRLGADVVASPQGSVRAEHVVVCADRSIPALGALASEIYHVQTFLGISEPLSAAALRRVFPAGAVMTWDSALIYSYFRLAEGNRLLLGGGNLLHTYASRPPHSLEPFARHAREQFESAFPDVQVRIESAWSGMLGVSKDLLPILGADPRRASICYVGAATGLPWAAALGRYAAERILDGRRDFDAAFSPARRFFIGPRLQALLSTPATFALSHAVTRCR
jgi:gamma-glutamylputrescine oxidase